MKTSWDVNIDQQYLYRWIYQIPAVLQKTLPITQHLLHNNVSKKYNQTELMKIKIHNTKTRLNRKMRDR